jgi:hypothetical protein
MPDPHPRIIPPMRSRFLMEVGVVCEYRWTCRRVGVARLARLWASKTDGRSQSAQDLRRARRMAGTALFV